jgi:predicted glycoside hydrolase/deacetylase ChbG (UPF0249 family)
MKHIIFCADDYGQNTTISQAIIMLLKKNHLSATSCLTTSNEWLTHAKWLEPYKNQADIGLHFNLTEGKPLSPQLKQLQPAFLPLSRLLIQSYLRQLDKNAIEAELNAQLDRFIEGLGQAPHFVDGHQHVHQFPVIRDALLNVYEKRLRSHGVYLRCVNNPGIWPNVRVSGYFKQCIIQLTGANTFKKALIKKRIPHNQSFSGIYDFKDAEEYASIFPSFIQNAREGGLIMCHPGLENSAEKDEIRYARQQEYRFISSDEFSQLCNANGVIVGRGNF